MTGLNTPSARKERPAVEAVAGLSEADNKAFEAMQNDTAQPEPSPAPEPEPSPEPVAEPTLEPTAEPTPQPEKTAAQTPEKTEPAKPGKPPEGFVPVQALQEARAETKETRAELKRITDAIMAKLQPHQEAPKADEPKIVEVPDENVDPIGAMKAMRHNMAVLHGQLQKQNERSANLDQRGQQAVQVKAIFDRAMSDQVTFKSTTPDYDEASGFLIASRREELSELIADGTPNKAQMIENQINQEKFNIAQRAATENRNAAEIVYKLAIKRGYTKKAAAVSTPSEAAKVNGVEKAQVANRSLGQVTGAAPNKAPLPQRMAAMSDAEFAAATSKMSFTELKNLMGA